MDCAATPELDETARPRRLITVQRPPGIGGGSTARRLSALRPRAPIFATTDRDETVAAHRPFAVLADYLTRNGIAVYRYDKRGVLRSTGDYSRVVTATLADDGFAAVKFDDDLDGEVFHPCP